MELWKRLAPDIDVYERQKASASHSLQEKKKKVPIFTTAPTRNIARDV